jgi:hypothetical protein
MSVYHRRDIKRLRRIAARLRRTKVLREDALEIIAAAQDVSRSAVEGYKHQARAELAHAEWEAANGPDLGHLH